MKIYKWIAVLAAAAVTGTALTWGGGWVMMRRAPAWYRHDTSTPEQRKAAAAKAENKLIAFYDWMAGSRAAEQRAAHSSTTTQAADMLAHAPAQPCAITFTDEELNAFFNKWADANDRREMYEKYIDEPRVVLRDQQLILAGTVKELGVVVSMQFEPRIDEQGKLNMNLVHVLGGVLPLPDSVWSGQRQKVEQALQNKLGSLQRKANISPDGVANGAAGSVAMNKLLWAVLHDRSAESVVFIPFDVTDLGRSLPVKVTNVEIKDHSITLTAEQLTPPARAGLLTQLREPYAEHTQTMNAGPEQASASQ